MTLPAISEKWASAVDAVTVPQGEQRAGYEMPSDWTRARLDEIEAKRERQRAYLRRGSLYLCTGALITLVTTRVMSLSGNCLGFSCQLLVGSLVL